MSYLASFEGKYPKNLFNKSVVASDNQTLIGHVAKETNELIVVFSESDRKVRFDIPKSEITFTGSSVVMNNNTADIQKYKVYRDTPLPQDNKSMIPTAAAQKEDVNQILSDESSSSNTKEKESSATTTTSAAKLLLQQISIRKEVKEEATAKIPVQTATKAKTKEAIPTTTTTTTTTTTAVPRSNYTTINKVQQEKIQQPGPIRATTTTAQLPKEPSNATTTTIPEDRSSLTNKKEEEKQKEAIATSKKEEAIMPKVLAVPSEQATNETSRLMDKPPITKEESKISPASSSSTPSSSTIPSSETTPTNVSVEKEPSEKIVEEEAVETAVEKAVTKAETEEAASSTLRNMKIQQQHQEQSREQGTKEQTLSHVETEEEEEEEAVPPNVEVTLKPPHNIEFSPPISAVNVPKALEESGTSTTERKARQDKQHFTNELFPITTIMALWQYSIIDGIDICNEFATNVAKAAEYWFDVFWNPAARRKEERKEKVIVR
jgi:hypothetical protein